MKEYMLEPDRISICTWIICWWTPFPILSLSKVQNSVEYVVNRIDESAPPSQDKIQYEFRLFQRSIFKLPKLSWVIHNE